MEDKQLSLFDNPIESKSSLNKVPDLVMTKSALEAWKSRIFSYQQQLNDSLHPQQSSLFDEKQTHCDEALIDPFSLQLKSMSFYRMPMSDSGDPCIYFVIDCIQPLLLYVGETKSSNYRWKSAHDCKSYLMTYVELHRKYGLDVAINVAFWWDTPASRKARLALEQSLIQRWRPPFNKEMWHLYGQPFKSIGP